MSTSYNGSTAYAESDAYIGPDAYIGSDAYNQAELFSLLRLDESIVSMICHDGTDGKAGQFQLHAVFDDGGNHSASCVWTSSNPANAIVSGTGLVSSVLGGSGNAVISCSYNGTTVAALVTVYPTMPDANVLYTLPGGKHSGSTSFAYIGSQINTLGPMQGSRYRGKISTGVNNTLYAVYNNTESTFMDTYAGNLDKYNVTNLGGTATTIGYGRTAPISGVNVDLDLASQGPLSTTYYVNNLPYTAFYQVTYTSATDAYIALPFVGGTGEKIINFSLADSSKSLLDLANYVQCPIYYVPQNFVKYTDEGARVNYTEILNFGTAGNSFNLSSNNVPAGWF